MEVEVESSSGKHGARGKVNRLIGGGSWRWKLEAVVENVEAEVGGGSREQ